MHKGIYIALSGAVLKQGQLDLLSNNIANANTVGFKKSRSSFKEHLLSRLSGTPESDDGRAMSDLSAVRNDFSEGNHFKTGNPLDVALDGNGFFSLEGGRYTRKGDFRVSGDGYLIAQGGRKVLGAKGPIKLPPGKADITTSGDVRVDGKPVDTLKIVSFGNTDSLVQLEDSQFTTDMKPAKSNAVAMSGNLEASNVYVVKEMVQLLATMREFESYQKVIQAFDDAASRVNNEMARI